MNTSVIDSIIQTIVSFMPHQPKAQIIQELTTVVERVSFVPEAEALLQQPDTVQFQSSLSYLFQGDVSFDMLQALAQLHRQGQSLVLAREQSGLLMQRCEEYLQGIKEIRVITAVSLSRSLEQRIADRFQAASQDPIRVVFEVLPSLIGGCMIVSPDGSVVDYSFKTNVSFYTHRYLERKLKEIMA